MKILIVEDDPDVLELMQLVLARDIPAAVTFATHDARTALSLVTEEAPDVIVLDSGVPGMSTEALAERIEGVSPASRLVLYSALDRSALAEKSCALGVPAFGKTELSALVDFIARGR